MNEAAQKALEKIKKILAKTENNASQAEVEVAFAKAQEIARKHAIDISSLRTDSSGKPEYEMEAAAYDEEWRSIRICDDYICRVLKATLRVVPFKSKWYVGPGHFKVKFSIAGEVADVEFAKYLYDWLTDVFQKGLCNYCRANGIKKNRDTERSYFQGMEDGLIQANREQEKKTETASTAIVLASKKDAVVAFTKTLHLITKKSKAWAGQNNGAHSAGFAEGVNTKFRKAIGD